MPLPNKRLWIDTETGGTDPVENEILQIAGIIEVNDEIVDEFEFRAAPTRPDDVVPRALQVQGRTLEEVMSWPPASRMYQGLVSKLDRHVAKFNKMDKYTPCGHNVKFDLDFLFSFFKSNKDKYLGSYITYGHLDTMVMATLLRLAGKADPVDEAGKPIYKLDALCDFFGVARGGHDALADIRATRAVGMVMFDLLLGYEPRAREEDYDAEERKSKEKVKLMCALCGRAGEGERRTIGFGCWDNHCSGMLTYAGVIGT